MRTYRADNARENYVRSAAQKEIIFSHTLIANTPTNLVTYVTTLQVAVDPTATGTRITFKTLVGNIPDSGVVVIGAEQIRFGSVSFATPTTGYLNNCVRGFNGTVAAAHGANTAITFDNAQQFPYLEEVVVYNNTGGDLFVGSNANVFNGANSVIVPNTAYGYWGFWISKNQNLWVMSVGGGQVTARVYGE